ncbi:MAG: methyltransferase domain-containing protein, partial [Vallitaleaceae bacterium]|nr:methyltransferase domain-containing protein [Vallitaleaceae bacterium]
TGDLWKDHLAELPEGINLYLSDFTEGMVKELSEKYNDFEFIKTEIIDIQDIPYEVNFFDVIIANFMLYHVPDIDNALREVHRVLKPNGFFYAATVGNNHLMEINQWVKAFDGHLDVFNSSALSFRVQNGEDILRKYFEQVSLLEYFDHLEVDSKQDLLQYIGSFKDMSDLSDEAINGLSEFLEQHRQKDDNFKISKQSGTFICRKG